MQYIRPYTDEKFEQSAVKLNSRDSTSFKQMLRSSESTNGNNITQNEIKIESEQASDRDIDKVQTFGKEQPIQLKKYATESTNQPNQRATDLNVNAPLQDKSLQDMINDDSLHKYEKLQQIQLRSQRVDLQIERSAQKKRYQATESTDEKNQLPTIDSMRSSAENGEPADRDAVASNQQQQAAPNDYGQAEQQTNHSKNNS